MTQRTLEDESLANTHLEGYMGHLTAGTDYTLALLDDDADDCRGSLIKQIGSFTANEKRRGKLTIDDIEQDIDQANQDRDESIVGAWMQLSDPNGAEVGCCEIIEYQDYWLRKKAVEFGTN